jgi:ribonuclease-3
VTFVPSAKARLEELQRSLGYSFSKIDLLKLALTHPSVAHETTAPTPHNQRLEFLGDAVLGLVLTRELYDRFAAVSEGPLTKARAQLVNRRSLADQARRFRLGEFLILSRGEESSGGREKQSALADAFEALLGAIFVDGGFEAARDFILKCFHDSFGQLTRIPNIDNPKGELQEMLQARSAEAPEYQTTSVTGPDHDRLFECAVLHEGRELGRGKGKSKKSAESEAALAALRTLQKAR